MRETHLLVPFDGSRRAERLLEHAAGLASDGGAQLTVLVQLSIEEPSRCCNLQTTFWNSELRRLAAETAGRARSLIPGDVDGEVRIRRGHGRTDVLAAAAELGCDTIVDTGRGGRIRRRPAVPAGRRQRPLTY